MPTIAVRKDVCKGCYLCVPVCKPRLLSRQSADVNRAGYYPVDFDDPEGRCTACKVCAQVCPDIAIRVFK